MLGTQKPLRLMRRLRIAMIGDGFNDAFQQPLRLMRGLRSGWRNPYPLRVSTAFEANGRAASGKSSSRGRSRRFNSLCA